MKELKLKKGETVIMHGCPQAELSKNKGRLWRCAGDSFEKHNTTIVYLEDYSGYFETKYLLQVDIEGFIDRCMYNMQTVEVNKTKTADVIHELGSRGIMFVMENSDEPGFAKIHFRAPLDVVNHLYFNVL